MLRDRILPSGIGHTTNCFIQVEGTDEVEGYAMKEGSTERYGIKVLRKEVIFGWFCLQFIK